MTAPLTPSSHNTPLAVSEMRLEEILSDKDFGLQMRFIKGDIAHFYRAGPEHQEIIAERRKWIASDPQRYLALESEGVALLDEAVQMGISLETLEDGFRDLEPLDRCRALAEQWEADFLLMRPDADGIYRMVGGGLCFPSHWALSEKMNQSMMAIHEPVPGINETLGRQIDGFLQRIKPGISWERFNWGLSRSADRNLHPCRDVPRLDALVSLEEVWWRLEEQSLVALPKSGGILFGIKIVVEPLSQIKANPTASRGLIRALQTMPKPMADYKGITPAKERLVELMME